LERHTILGIRPKKFTNACKSRPFPGVMNKSVSIVELGLHEDDRRRSLQFMKASSLKAGR
jgi:hypothetical protein